MCSLIFQFQTLCGVKEDGKDDVITLDRLVVVVAVGVLFAAQNNS